MTDKMKIVMTLEFDVTYEQFVKKFKKMDKVAVDAIWKSLKEIENDKGEVEFFDDGNDEVIQKRFEKQFFDTTKEQIEDEQGDNSDEE
jgi:hypothetical protein